MRMISWRTAVTICAGVLFLVILFFGARALGQKTENENQQMVDRSIRRAAVACYALEGFYPRGLDYLEEHYGVTIDDAYFVDYQYVASNLMPEITVVALS